MSSTKEQGSKENPSAAAHLIHGSSDGRFNIVYAVSHLTKDEVEQVGFKYMSYEEAATKYKPEGIVDGYFKSGDDEWFIFQIPLSVCGQYRKNTRITRCLSGLVSTMVIFEELLYNNGNYSENAA